MNANGWMVGVFVAITSVATGCHERAKAVGISPQEMTDALFSVMAADRAVYTREVVSRLQDQENLIRASEHYQDDKTLPLPAQMFRMGAEASRKAQSSFTYALLSPWPINKQNAPRTDIEKAGLRTVAEAAKNYYADERLGGVQYFTAVYPDRAVSDACVTCHNGHSDSPRHDFKVGDIMGGVVIRVPIH